MKDLKWRDFNYVQEMETTFAGTGIATWLLLAITLALPSTAAITFDHVVVVIEENRGYSQIVGSASAPYINALAAGGALFSNYYAITHPSQPNYLQLFSGSNQGVTSNATPAGKFSAPNLGGQLIAAGLTFKGFSEDLPSESFNGDNAGGPDGYWRKHNPWINFIDVPAASNRPFTDFPADYTTLPTVSFIVPNQANDMHNGTIAQGDSWLQTNLGGYATWAATHNSLLIVTFDEDDGSEGNHVATIIFGANVITGVYSDLFTTYSLLRTVEDLYGLPYAGAAASANSMAPFQPSAIPEPGSAVLMLAGLSCLLAVGKQGRKA